MNYSRAMHLPDCYKILGVHQGAGWQDIKKSYYDLAKRYHPDRNPANPASEDRFKKIALAFSTLEKHVRVTEPDFDPMESIPREQKQGWSQWYSRTMESLRIFERKVLLLDVRTNITVDSPTAKDDRTIKVQTSHETFYVRVPESSWNNWCLRIPGKGVYGILNRERGDLLLNVNVLPAGISDGEDYHYNIRIPRKNIERRKMMTLQTPEGPIRYSLPKNTVDGQTFALKSKIGASSNHVITVFLF